VRHFEGFNTVFADGHVKYVKLETARNNISMWLYP